MPVSIRPTWCAGMRFNTPITVQISHLGEKGEALKAVKPLVESMKPSLGTEALDHPKTGE